MNYKIMGRFIAQILSIEMLFMLPALGISLGFCEWNAVRGFLYTITLIGLVSLALFLICRKAPNALNAREGMVCVGISWIVLSLFGCLPFFISRDIPRYIDAFFEIVSGFTTTGSSVVADVEALAKGNLYWRSFSHWLGGMGVLVFLLAIAPGSKEKGFTMHLLRAESPGPNVGKLVPRMRKTAGILYIIYIVMTLINVIFLLIGKMPLFDAICTAFGTAGTGGFGIKNDSFGSYSPYLQNVTTIFMLLFGINFSCYYLLLLKQFRAVFKDEELRTYVSIVLGCILLITLDLHAGGFYSTLEESVRHAAFQVGSIVTTTGYATTDFDLWPSFSKAILLCLMVIGASAGSTGGGLKVGRLMLLVKGLRRNIRQMLNPRKVEVVRNNGSAVDEKVLANTNAYLAAYVLIIFGVFAVISLDGFSTGTNFSAVLACFNNIGPGLAGVGPMSNFSSYSIFSKFVLMMGMLIGRLELYPIILLLVPETWRRK